MSIWDVSKELARPELQFKSASHLKSVARADTNEQSAAAKVKMSQSLVMLLIETNKAARQHNRQQTTRWYDDERRGEKDFAITCIEFKNGKFRTFHCDN